MPALTQAGFEIPIFIKKNGDCITFADTTITVGTTTYTVIHNGIIRVSAAFTATNYISFAALVAAFKPLTAIVQNIDTGEIRYYLASNDADVYIDPLYDCVAVCQDFNWRATRQVTQIKEVANPECAELKEGVAMYEGTISKAWSGRWKTAYTGSPEAPTAVSATSRIVAPIGMTGIEAILDRYGSTTQQKDGYSPYFCVIIYARDNSTLASLRANPMIFPCCKFEDCDGKSEADGVYYESLKFKSVDMMHGPRDTYQAYKMVQTTQQ